MKCNDEAKFSKISNSVHITLFTNKIDYVNIISSLSQRVLKSNTRR
jgi:hypothetical protein